MPALVRECSGVCFVACVKLCPVIIQFHLIFLLTGLLMSWRQRCCMAKSSGKVNMWALLISAYSAHISNLGSFTGSSTAREV
jgi:hypothetical protein